MKIIAGVAVFLVMVSSLLAQQHAFPVNEGLGVPGPKARSFIIGWHPVPGVVAYEYVLTDNFLCFAGCAGDTRQEMVQDTFTIEYELLPDKQYYWVTRVHFENGETGPWSLISEFWSWTPPVQPILRMSPNPVIGPVTVRLDWGATPDADLLTVVMMDLQGRQVMGPVDIRPSGIIRQEERVWRDLDLRPGVYLLKVEARTNDGRTFQPLTQSVLVR